MLPPFAGDQALPGSMTKYMGSFTCQAHELVAVDGHKLVLVVLDGDDLLRRAGIPNHDHEVLAFDAHQVLHRRLLWCHRTSVSWPPMSFLEQKCITRQSMLSLLLTA